MKNFLRYAGFYILLLGSVILFTFYQFNPVAFYFIFIGTILTAMVLEKFIPYDKSWTEYKGDLKHDILYAFSTILLGPFVKTFVIYMIVKLHSWMPESNLGLGNCHLVFQFLTAILISGFLPYWYHRLSHTSSRFLWKIHSIHHSPEKLYWLNGFRFHPINAVLNAGLSLFPLMLLGFSSELIIFVGFVNNYVSILNHTNIDFRLGKMNLIFNMSECHRWHHSAKLEEGNSNFSGGSLIVWDLVFSSYYCPRKKIGNLGLFNESRITFPYKSFIGQIIYPFRK